MSKVLPISGRPPAPPAGSAGLNSVEEIVAELKAGRMVVIMDDEDRENEGDLIMAAELATPEAVAFMIRHTSGIICVPDGGGPAGAARSAADGASNSESHRTAFTVSVDVRAGTTTGVSSSDRAATIHALADIRSRSRRTSRGPGTSFRCAPAAAVCWCAPATPRRPWTSAAWPACSPWASSCEIMNDDGTMARRPELEAFAKRHGLKIGTIADLIRYRLRNERSVERIAEQPVQTELGEFRLYAYEDRVQPGRASRAGARAARRRGAAARARARGRSRCAICSASGRIRGLDAAGGDGADRACRQRRGRDPARPRVAARSGGGGAHRWRRRAPGRRNRTAAPGRAARDATARCCAPSASARRS